MPGPAKPLVERVLQVVRVEPDGRVILAGEFMSADNRGVHSLLQPVINLADLEPGARVRPGDSIAELDDGSRQHRPRGAPDGR